MSEDTNNNEMLHIHGQCAHHDDVEIMGNRAGLERLRTMLEAVLRKDNPTPIAKYESLWVGDGEGYGLLITLYDKPRFDDWGHVAVPYHVDWAQERREGAIWPNQVRKLLLAGGKP
jgi:hypothetical protein